MRFQDWDVSLNLWTHVNSSQILLGVVVGRVGFTFNCLSDAAAPSSHLKGIANSLAVGRQASFR